MTGTDFLCLTPLMIIAGAPVLMMLFVAIKRNLTIIYGFSIVAFIAAFLSLFVVLPAIPFKLSTLLVFDQFSILFFGIIILGSMLVTLISWDFIINQESEKEEYFIIMFIAALGSMILVSACNFVTLFLGLETLSISLFILIAYRRARRQSIEASVKYLVLASVSSAFLLFGMGLIYADTGTLEFSQIGRVLTFTDFSSPLLLTGFGMMLVGIGFKMALVPFHMWTPDIYQGGPVPVTTFIATISKGAVMALLIRFFFAIRGFHNHNFVIVITLLAVLSMFVGNILAIRQQNIKRILAYSSIANMGYLLVTLLTGNEYGIKAATFYIISYTITTLGAFEIVGLLSSRQNEREHLDQYKGLFWKNPFVAIVFTLSLLSLAGIPITAGFIAKFYIVFSGINSGLWLLVISLIINTVIGLYYYLRVITALFSPPGDADFPPITLTGHVVLAIVAIGILWLGIFPEWIVSHISGFSGL